MHISVYLNKESYLVLLSCIRICIRISEADGELPLIQTFLLYYVNQVILMLTSIFQGQFP